MPLPPEIECACPVTDNVVFDSCADIADYSCDMGSCVTQTYDEATDMTTIEYFACVTTPAPIPL